MADDNELLAKCRKCVMLLKNLWLKHCTYHGCSSSGRPIRKTVSNSPADDTKNCLALGESSNNFAHELIKTKIFDTYAEEEQSYFAENLLNLVNLFNSTTVQTPSDVEEMVDTFVTHLLATEGDVDGANETITSLIELSSDQSEVIGESKAVAGGTARKRKNDDTVGSSPKRFAARSVMSDRPFRKISNKARSLSPEVRSASRLSAADDDVPSRLLLVKEFQLSHRKKLKAHSRLPVVKDQKLDGTGCFLQNGREMNLPSFNPVVCLNHIGPSYSALKTVKMPSSSMSLASDNACSQEKSLVISLLRLDEQDMPKFSKASQSGKIAVKPLRKRGRPFGQRQNRQVKGDGDICSNISDYDDEKSIKSILASMTDQVVLAVDGPVTPKSRRLRRKQVDMLEVKEKACKTGERMRLRDRRIKKEPEPTPRCESPPDPAFVYKIRPPPPLHVSKKKMVVSKISQNVVGFLESEDDVAEESSIDEPSLPSFHGKVQDNTEQRPQPRRSFGRLGKKAGQAIDKEQVQIKRSSAPTATVLPRQVQRELDKSIRSIEGEKSLLGTVTSNPKLCGDVSPKKCEYCPRQYGSLWELRKHVQMAHQFTCDHCFQTFASKLDLSSHVQTVHIVQRTRRQCHHCETCDEAFPSKSAYEAHLPKRRHTTAANARDRLVKSVWNRIQQGSNGEIAAPVSRRAPPSGVDQANFYCYDCPCILQILTLMRNCGASSFQSGEALPQPPRDSADVSPPIYSNTGNSSCGAIVTNSPEITTRIIYGYPQPAYLQEPPNANPVGGEAWKYQQHPMNFTSGTVQQMMPQLSQPLPPHPPAQCQILTADPLWTAGPPPAPNSQFLPFSNTTSVTTANPPLNTYQPQASFYTEPSPPSYSGNSSNLTPPVSNSNNIHSPPTDVLSPFDNTFHQQQVAVSGYQTSVPPMSVLPVSHPLPVQQITFGNPSIQTGSYPPPVYGVPPTPVQTFVSTTGAPGFDWQGPTVQPVLPTYTTSSPSTVSYDSAPSFVLL